MGVSSIGALHPARHTSTASRPGEIDVGRATAAMKCSVLAVLVSVCWLNIACHCMGLVGACHFTNQVGHPHYSAPTSVTTSKTVHSGPSGPSGPSGGEPCSNLCAVHFKGSCQCSVVRRDTASVFIRLECWYTNASLLGADIDHLTSGCNLTLVQLHVTNSNLSQLYHLPSGLYNVQEMVLQNTGIDLETIRESNELLKTLRILRISNDNYTEIPETLFNGMDDLQELSLNNLGLAYLSADAFLSLQDSLTLLELRSNKIRTIPNAVQMLSHLECLDLSGNDIKTVSDGNSVIFSTGLKRLKRLRINLSKCSCEFGKSKFATWLRAYAIKGVTCSVPDRLRTPKEVSNTPLEEFCEPLLNASHFTTPVCTTVFALVTILIYSLLH